MNKSLVTLFLLTVFLIAVSTAQEPKKRAKTGDQPHHEMKLSGDMAKDMRMMNDMMVKHLGSGDSDYEKRFIDMMIPHHEGAILMSKSALKNAKKPELKEMAQKMIADQEKEIEMLKKLRKEWYGNN